MIIPGKDAFSDINKYLQDKFNISVTPTSVIEAMKVDEIPLEMRNLLNKLNDFSKHMTL